MSLVSDTHGDFSRFYKLNAAVPENEIWGVIILGDSGVNFWLSKRDKILKHRICKKYPKLRFYLVRGNHEERPNNIAGMIKLWTHEVGNFTYWESDFSNIYYLIDGHEYMINGYRTLIVGGAYSIDKDYRLERAAAGGYAGWFEEEQLSQEERDNIMNIAKGQHYDLILAHTCPYEWMPRDLFLSFIDQSKVDNTMEIWLGELVKACSFNVFLCGHFHDDRILAPHAEMLSLGIKNLDDIIEYWKN